MSWVSFFQGVTSGLLLLLATLLVQRCFTPKSALLMTTVHIGLLSDNYRESNITVDQNNMNLFNQTSISTGTSIYLIVCLCRVVVLEKNVVNQLWVDGHRQSASMISLLIIFICCVTELLVCLSVFVTCLTYADVVERLNVYRTVLDLQQTVHQFRFLLT